MIDQEELEGNVDAGIELLDEKGPDEWRKKLDLDILDIDSCDLCVLGQLYGHTIDGKEQLDISNLKLFGFWPIDGTEDCSDRLTEIWKKKLSPESVN